VKKIKSIEERDKKIKFNIRKIIMEERDTNYLWNFYTNYNYRMSLRKKPKPKLKDILSKNEYVEKDKK